MYIVPCPWCFCLDSTETGYVDNLCMSPDPSSQQVYSPPDSLRRPVSYQCGKCRWVCMSVCVRAISLGRFTSWRDGLHCVVELSLQHNVASSAKIEYCSIPAWQCVALHCGALHTHLMFTSLRSYVTWHDPLSCIEMNQPLLLNTHIHLHISHTTGGYVHRWQCHTAWTRTERDCGAFKWHKQAKQITPTYLMNTSKQ